MYLYKAYFSIAPYDSEQTTTESGVPFILTVPAPGTNKKYAFSFTFSQQIPENNKLLVHRYGGRYDRTYILYTFNPGQQLVSTQSGVLVTFIGFSEGLAIVDVIYGCIGGTTMLTPYIENSFTFKKYST